MNRLRCLLLSWQLHRDLSRLRRGLLTRWLSRLWQLSQLRHLLLSRQLLSRQLLTRQLLSRQLLSRLQLLLNQIS